MKDYKNTFTALREKEERKARITAIGLSLLFIATMFGFLFGVAYWVTR